MLVIAHHAAQPYGPTGGSWPIANDERSFLLGPFFSVNAAFFMGLFFLLAGYFVPNSCEKKGVVGFLKERFIRLGIPVLFFALFLFGPLSFFEQNVRLSFTEFVRFHYSTGWQALYAHLWFLLHLLLYSLVFVLWRFFDPSDKIFNALAKKPPTHLRTVVFIFALSIATWFVRIWYPIDRWIAFLFLIPAEIAHLPQYFSLFAIGILAYRNDWLRNIPTDFGLKWLWVGIVAAAAYYAYRLLGAPYFPRITSSGGFNWQSFVWCVWEASICVGFCMGLPILFRESLNGRPGKIGLIMILAAYGAYIIHVPLLVGIQFGMHASVLPPFAKFMIVTIVGVILSFGVSYTIRFLPGAKKIL